MKNVMITASAIAALTLASSSFAGFAYTGSVDVSADSFGLGTGASDPQSSSVPLGGDVNVAATSLVEGNEVEASVSATSDLFTLTSSWNGVGFGGNTNIFGNVDFTATSAGQAIVSWDFAGLGNGFSFSGFTGIDVDLSASSGEVTVDLEAGDSFSFAPFFFGDYAASGEFGGGPPASGFLTVEYVPAPAAAGLFAVAGAAASRRRRA